jgi:hypothetical protein
LQSPAIRAVLADEHAARRRSIFANADALKVRKSDRGKDRCEQRRSKTVHNSKKYETRLLAAARTASVLQPEGCEGDVLPKSSR